MKNIIFILILIFCSTFLFAQTTIPGGDVSGTWILSGSPYLIEGEITIPNGETLTIEPGILVEFQGHYKFNVQGQLLAVGTEQDSIVFTAVDPDSGWHGIRFDNTPTTNDSSRIAYCYLMNGIAEGYPPDLRGGAIYVDSFSKIRISDSCFENNKAVDVQYVGGGGYAKGSGGALHIRNSADILVDRILFLMNEAYYGGTIYCYESQPTFNECNFFENNAIVEGGGIATWEASIEVRNCIFYQNSANEGGAILLHEQLGSNIVNNIFSNNSANHGGAIYSRFCNNGYIVNNLLCNNYAVAGGGFFLQNFEGEIINCSIIYNEAQYGGAIYFHYSDEPSLINTIIYDNNSIIEGDQVYLHSSDSNPYFLYCDVDGGVESFGGNGAGTYNITHYQNCFEVDPMFVLPSMGYGVSTNGLLSDFSLNTYSPCIEAGDPETDLSLLPLFDIAGNLRFIFNYVDIGAYEFSSYFADFIADPQSGDVPLTVQFNDESVGLPTFWEWDFNNDGFIDSYEQNPLYIYELHGNYSVSLTSGNNNQSDTIIKQDYINVNYTVISQFSANILSGHAPLFINFTDESYGNIINWEWDFDNDGIIDSYLQNPVWEYTESGVYSVKLTVSDGQLEDTLIKVDYITIFPDNVIYGIITEDLVLEADTVNVIGEVTILNGITLTINPGVTMLFHDHYKLNVQGRLLAVGTEQDSINFTALDPDIGWHGIRFDNTPATNDSSKIVYCYLEFGKAIGGNWNDRSGGAVYIDDFSKILIFNCKFKNNYANSSGGAIFDGGGIRIDNSIISNNQSNSSGGGICVYGGSTINNSLIKNNYSSSGGGILIDGYPSGQISNLVIHSNSASAGGGLYIRNNTNVINCIITNNQSEGIYIWQSSPDIINCLISNNGNTGIYAWDEIWSDSYPNIVNCTVTNNDGYGIYYYEFEWWPDRKDEKYIENKVRSRFFRNRSLTGYSTILSGNTNGSVGYNENCLGLLYCSFSESVPSFAGIGCISIEPYFVNPTVGAGPDYNALEADWSLQSNSMCINHGIPDTTGLNIPELDLAGNPRVYQGENPRIDIGAYEFQGEPDQIPDIHAYPTELDLGLCTINQISLMKSFTISNFGYVNLEINSITATTGFLIKREDDPEFNPIIESFNIEPYEEETINVVFNPTSATNYIGYIVIDSNDPDEGLLLINTTGTGDIWPVVQGHITEDTFWDADTIKVIGNLTIDDGRTLTISPGVYIQFHGYYGLNVQGRILAEGTLQDSIIFIIADTSSPYNFWQGFDFDQTPVANDSSKFIFCKIEKAHSNSGGAFYVNDFSKIEISQCMLKNNRAKYSGGAIYINNSDIIIRNTLIFDNCATGYWDWEWNVPGSAGGLNYYNSVSKVINCIIKGNSAWEGDWGSDGGGILIRNSEVSIFNTLIYNNNSTYGGGIYSNNSDTDLINTTISLNSDYGYYGYNSSELIVINTIFWNDSEAEIIFSSYQEPNLGSFEYSCIEGGLEEIITNNNATINWLEGNIEDDPLFIDPENGDFHFFSNSPCINSGTPDTTGLNLPEYDLDGNPRVYEDRIDMGCYEWQGTGAENDQLPIVNYKLQNYPNPFNPETKIFFSIAGSEDNKQKVSVSVFNIRGQKVKTLVDKTMKPGRYSVIWNSKDQNNKPVSSGIYFYKLDVGGKTRKTRKMLLLK